MSHTTGKVFAQSGELIGFFEYDGTSDFACTSVKRTTEEVSRDWRSPAAWEKCQCVDSTSRVSVVLHSNYGGCTQWASEVCTACMAITGATKYEDHEDCDKRCWDCGTWA